MIISDSDLINAAKAMGFEGSCPELPFEASQIQPASIDLRLDNVFWIPRKPRIRRVIDLRSPVRENTQIEGYYERRVLGRGEGITLQPGQMILGRVYESFRISSEHVAIIKGRSSFARLGLSVHCTGDFINPNWNGHMPLQIVNHGRVPVILVAYIPICQLLLVALSKMCDRPYGADGLDSKYADDEGEPSRYWRDARLKKLQASIGQVDLPENIREVFRNIVAAADTHVADRFHAFMERMALGSITDARDVLVRFARQEAGWGKWEAGYHYISKWLAFGLLSISIGLAFKGPYEWGHYLCWAITSLMLWPGLYFQLLSDPPSKRFTQADVDAYYRQVP